MYSIKASKDGLILIKYFNYLDILAESNLFYSLRENILITSSCSN